MLSTATSILTFLIVLGIAIFIHELGHFIFAKRAGIFCYEFAIGMGPKVYSKKYGETEYSVRAIPLGGFVSMAGEGLEMDEELPVDRLFQSKPLFDRFLAVFAGPFFNFILAFLLITGVSLVTGIAKDINVIGGFTEGQPAENSLLEIGDEITSINGVEVSTWTDILETLSGNEGNTVELTYVREGVTSELSIEPLFVEEEGRYMVGIRPYIEVERGFFKSIANGFNTTISMIGQMFEMISMMISGAVSPSNISGPVGIYSIVKQQASLGLVNLLSFMAFLSVNLGFMNLLPLPALDGGRLIFIGIEAVTRKKVNAKIENYIHAVGLIALFTLLLLVTWNDIMRLFG
jgi:regulator of sigma E protease